MEKICKNCKCWDREFNTVNGEPPKSGKGICISAVHEDAFAKETESNMVVMDASGYMAMLATSPEHSCSEFV